MNAEEQDMSSGSGWFHFTDLEFPQLWDRNKSHGGDEGDNCE